MVRSEWTKFGTQPGTTLWMLGTVLLTTALGVAGVAALAATSLVRDPVRLSLSGLDLGQALVVILAVRFAAGEWGTGMALATYGATPRRLLVLASKAIVLGAAVTVSALPAVAGIVLAGHLILTRAGGDGGGRRGRRRDGPCSPACTRCRNRGRRPLPAVQPPPQRRGWTRTRHPRAHPVKLR